MAKVKRTKAESQRGEVAIIADVLKRIEALEKQQLSRRIDAAGDRLNCHDGAIRALEGIQHRHTREIGGYDQRLAAHDRRLTTQDGRYEWRTNIQQRHTREINIADLQAEAEALRKERDEARRAAESTAQMARNSGLCVLAFPWETPPVNYARPSIADNANGAAANQQSQSAIKPGKPEDWAS